MIKSYFLGLFTFIIIDTLWIKFFVLNLYIKSIPEILSLTQKGLAARKEPALLFYFIFYNCLFYFCTVKVGSEKDSLITGAALGLMTYSTYALTNHTIMKQWGWLLSLTDILWGMSLCALVSFVIYQSRK